MGEHNIELERMKEAYRILGEAFPNNEFIFSMRGEDGETYASYRGDQTALFGVLIDTIEDAIRVLKLNRKSFLQDLPHLYKLRRDISSAMEEALEELQAEDFEEYEEGEELI